MKETRREYLKRIHIVLDFIEKNLDADLSLEAMAEKAHYSPFHFHRVFVAIVGERLLAYITRKRIERIASILLVKPRTPLKDLAFTYGFNSDNSFSRTFKKYYGISPTTFKSEGKKLLSKIGIEPFSNEKYICSIDNLQQWIKMNAQISIKQLVPRQLASISGIGDFDKIGSMYQSLMEWGHQHDVLATTDFKAITIYHDNPHVTDTSKLRFSACITISKSIKADGEIRPLTLGQGLYAVGRFEVKGDDIGKAWKGMNTWIIENELEFRDGDYFEMYHNDHKTHPEQKFILDICIPIERTDNITLGEIKHVDLGKPEKHLDYHQLIDYMKTLRAFFAKEYDTRFKLGNIYKGSPDYSYFSLITEALKKQKLKFVIVLDHRSLRFSICLSGQNKRIRKKYWEIFRGSDWNKYHLVESIDDSLYILDHTLVEEPDFKDSIALTEQLEKEALMFIKALRDILE